MTKIPTWGLANGPHPFVHGKSLSSISKIMFKGADDTHIPDKSPSSHNSLCSCLELDLLKGHERFSAISTSNLGVSKFSHGKSLPTISEAW